MTRKTSSKTTIAVLTSAMVVGMASESRAQYQRRYQPSRPTVSPYLNLFRFNPSPIPNYQSLVRPEQESLRFQQRQQIFDRQQTQELNRLQTSVNVLQQAPVATELVAPTGKGAWFQRQGGASFQNTSRYYSQSGGAGAAVTAPRR